MASVFSKRAAFLVPGMACLLWSAPQGARADQLALRQVVEYTLKNNGAMNSFRQEKGIAEAGKTRAGLLPNPTLELEAATGALTGSSEENSVSVGVSQEFLVNGKRGRRLSVAERELEMYRWQLADRERLLRAEAASAFYDVVLAKERVALADRAIALNRQLLAVAGERLAAGDIPELELNLVKVELARSEGDRSTSASSLTQSKAKLLTLMGVPAGESHEVAGALEAGSEAALPPGDLKQLALAKRPDLMALEAEKGRGDADIALARAEAVPNLTAGLAVSRDTSTMEIGGVEGKDTAYIIGVKLSMPITVFDRNQAGVREASARRESTSSRLAAARKSVEREVETALASLQSADKVLSLYRTGIVPQLDENLKLTGEAYRIGEVGILSVIQEQKKFFEVNEGYLAARHHRQVALVMLETAVAAELTGGAQ